MFLFSTVKETLLEWGKHISMKQHLNLRNASQFAYDLPLTMEEGSVFARRLMGAIRAGYEVGNIPIQLLHTHRTVPSASCHCWNCRIAIRHRIMCCCPGCVIAELLWGVKKVRLSGLGITLRERENGERERYGEKKRWRRERVHLEALRGTRTILYMFHGSFLGKITSLKTNSKHFESPST